MLIRLIYEDEEVTKIKESIQNLNVKQLRFLEEIIRREKMNRKKDVFNQWVKVLNEYVTDKKEE
ncbi:MAG: hypothetical protein ACOY3J_02935 [Bacillota bacterium]|uniref:Uncharacterized protein n=1 Tax=Thermanaerosceptrum fracticalcis TaxID=1712410 RepID=A0A7G6E131_THEFR|nr:hypothetical protein [Thermanaerosceptrum fracticalcis]QNB45785.1 hypothetical protein BR63_05330 [Thermanaerosceptrum fracticalcis]